MATELLADGEAWRVELQDAFVWLDMMPAESVDLALLDPPYESLEKHRAKGTTTRLKKSKASSNEWFPIVCNSMFPALAARLYRVLKKNRHCYVFCDAETMFVLKPAFEAVGFKFWKPIVWDKVSIGMGYHYRARYEFILFFEKGKRRLNDLAQADVITEKRLRGDDVYPAQKPVEVLEVLIRNSTTINDVVIDPFAGSFSTGEAALINERRFLGCDIKVDAVELGTKRLREL